MQRKIGEVFTTSDGVTLKVEPKQQNEQYGRCFGCYFEQYCFVISDKEETEPCKGVIFVEVEPEKE